MLKIERLNFLEYHIKNFGILDTGLYGFIGQNGAGKSTFFSILNQEILVEDANVFAENVMYLSNLNGFDKNLKGMDYFKILSADEYAKAQHLAEKFEAESFLNKRIGKYSLGMLQQFAIILSLAVNSEIVILDEIHSGLDIKHQRIFFEQLEEEKLEKIVLLTSHYLEDIKKHCDKSFFLGEGIEPIVDFSSIENRILGG